MAIRAVVKMGNKQLATPSERVVDFSVLPELLQDMCDTMRAKGGIGIAAPQIGINLRVVIFGFDKSERYPNAEPIPFTVLVNPVIDILGTHSEEGWEGCLSVPGLRGRVPRHTHIRYSGVDETGAPFTREVMDFHARVVQHECDHLDGILFPQRMRDLSSLGFEDELGDITHPLPD